MLKNLSKPMQLALLAVLGIGAYLALGTLSSPDTPRTAPKKVASKSTTKKGADLYTDEDAKVTQASFDPVKGTPKDVFVPIIKKPVNGGKGSQVNVVPPEFAGGEPNWVYTGSAQIDGVLQALLQNNTTGDNVFLKVGDTWKGVSVEEITDDSLVLSSPELGIDKKLELPPDVVTGPASGPAGFAPASVGPLRGSIGPMSVQPDPNAVAQDPNGGLPNNGMLPGNYGNGGGFGNGGGGGRRGRRAGGGGGGPFNGGGG